MADGMFQTVAGALTTARSLAEEAVATQWV